MRIVVSRSDFAEARALLPSPVGLVPTMGALHAGHDALLRAARTDGAAVVATIFVNPLQFGPNEDFARYPRSLPADLALAEAAGVDLVWTPTLDDVYAAGPAQVTIAPGPLAAELEGASRPGHFAGVLTVVGKLFQLVRPDAAYFGEKDYQQLTLIRRMVRDLDFSVDVRGVATVREPDGLALSSRNAYLSEDQREQATVLSRALFAGQAAGALGADAVLAAARKELDAIDEIVVDYLELRSPDLQAAPESGEARLLVAARVGTTRLIDNVGLTL